MSKIGKKPIKIPAGITVEIQDSFLEAKNKETSIKVKLLPGIKVVLENNQISFLPQGSDKQTMSNWGTIRALTANAIQGLSQEFVKELVIEGVGYRAEAKGNQLILNVGFSHPVNFLVPPGIKVAVEKNLIRISGADKQLVGETAAKIRKIKEPEPYKGKGIMYKNEIIRRKAGKKAVASA